MSLKTPIYLLWTSANLSWLDINHRNSRFEIRTNIEITANILRRGVV